MEGTHRIVGVLAGLDALDPSVTVDAAVATLSATTDVSFGVMLADLYGWSFDEIETWMVATNRRLLLRGG